MVFLWAWRITGWRWLTHKQQNMPKYWSAIIFGSLLATLLKSADPYLHEAGPYTKSYRARVIEAGNSLLDDRKITILAARRWKMLKDQKEAQEYFEANGHVVKPTNRYVMLNDSLGF
jgi:hypothetical protein